LNIVKKIVLNFYIINPLWYIKSKHDSLENFKHIMKEDYNKTIKY